MRFLSSNKLRIKEPSFDDKLNSKSISPYISQYAEDTVEKVHKKNKISEACNFLNLFIRVLLQRLF